MITTPDPDGLVWHTSSYSHGGSACVEVATAQDAVLIRDSGDRTGPALTVLPTAWRAFLTALPH